MTYYIYQHSRCTFCLFVSRLQCLLRHLWQEGKQPRGNNVSVVVVSHDVAYITMTMYRLVCAAVTPLAVCRRYTWENVTEGNSCFTPAADWCPDKADKVIRYEELLCSLAEHKNMMSLIYSTDRPWEQPEPSDCMSHLYQRIDIHITCNTPTLKHT